MKKNADGKHAISTNTKAERKKAARRARRLTFLLICVIIASLAACYALVLKPRSSYDKAEAHFAQHEWLMAEMAYRSLGKYEDSQEKASFAECMRLFDESDLDKAAVVYEQLSEDHKARAREELGSFSALAEQAIEQDRYEDAYKYYSLDKENPDSTDVMDALDVYIQASALMEKGEYAQARELITALPSGINAMSPRLQSLADDSFEKEYERYDALSYTDLDQAMQGMESIQDEYEPAAEFVKATLEAYNAGISLMHAEKYADARTLFGRIVSYSDCEYQIGACYVLEASALAEKGDEASALEMISSVDSIDEYLDLIPEDGALAALLRQEN